MRRGETPPWGLPDRGILFLLFLRCLIDFENEGMRRDSESEGWFWFLAGVETVW